MQSLAVQQHGGERGVSSRDIPSGPFLLPKHYISLSFSFFLGALEIKQLDPD